MTLKNFTQRYNSEIFKNIFFPMFFDLVFQRQNIVICMYIIIFLMQKRVRHIELYIVSGLAWPRLEYVCYQLPIMIVE